MGGFPNDTSNITVFCPNRVTEMDISSSVTPRGQPKSYPWERLYRPIGLEPMSNLDTVNLERLAQAHPGKTFPSIRQLARAAGIDHCTMHRWFKRGGSDATLWLVEDQRLKAGFRGGARGRLVLTSLATGPAVAFRPIIDASRKRLAQGSGGNIAEVDWTGLTAFERFRRELYRRIDAEDPSTRPRGWVAD